MSISLAVIMDPIETVKPEKDSTLAMLLAAFSRGWELLYFETENLLLDQGVARGFGRKLRVSDSTSEWYSLEEGEWLDLHAIDVILMRKDPPVDSQYLYTTYILEAAEKLGALVLNKPRSLRDCNEKIFATEFPQCCPSALISPDAEQIKAFYAKHQDIVLKPLDGMGGESVFRVRKDDPNINVMIEVMTQHGKRSIMAQNFIPEIAEGDKRILVIDGQPIPHALARIPTKNETRGNLAAGGRGEARELTRRDRWICEQVGPTLIERGLMFVGLDVIGDYLTEINITSPTCIRELDRQCGLDIAGMFMDKIEARLKT